MMKNITSIVCFVGLFIHATLNAQVGIGTVLPDDSSILDITAVDKGILAPRVSLANVTTTMLDGINTAATGLLIWNTNTATIGGDGIGFYVFTGAFWEKISTENINANNGLTLAGNEIVLGGTLNQNSTINHGNNSLNINLSGTGDFNIQDNGTTHFQVNDNGNSYFGGEVVVTEDAVSGTRVARLFNVADQDGALLLYRNNTVQHRIDAGFNTVFNEQGLDLDFVIESNNNPDAFRINAGEDVMFVGNALAGLANDGDIINGSPVDYVAAFYTPNFTNGTAVQIGTTEYIMDSGNLQMSVYGSWLPYYPMSSTSPFSLGNAAQRWTSVWAINGTVQTSDTRLKKNIKSLDYGLAEILKLNPISYQWKEGIDTSTKLGFSAEELLSTLPEVVVTHSYELDKEDGPAVKKENEYLGVYYSDIIPVLTNAIQDQQVLIEQLEQRIKNLEQKK